MCSTLADRLQSTAGSSDALLLARIADHSRPFFIITASAADAERLLAEIGWFAPHLKTHRLPDWETLPYDHFSPHPDLVSERLSSPLPCCAFPRANILRDALSS